MVKIKELLNESLVQFSADWRKEFAFALVLLYYVL